MSPRPSKALKAANILITSRHAGVLPMPGGITYAPQISLNASEQRI